jgi:hypothetical protein
MVFPSLKRLALQNSQEEINPTEQQKAHPILPKVIKAALAVKASFWICCGIAYHELH